MKLRQRLKNPFLLAGQGFALGAVLFFASQPGTSEARAAADFQSAAPAQATAEH